MSLVFVFMLASGAVFYQPESEENCAKLMVAFAKGEKVTATSVDGTEAQIVHGMCVRADQLDTLSTIQTAPAS
jgi:hypothetical protein